MAELWFLETKTISPEQALLRGILHTCLYMVRRCTFLFGMNYVAPTTCID